MDLVDIARWQFGIITVYHFLFVPLTIGLTALVAGIETAWLRTKNPEWLRLTRFFGKLMLINFAIGVVTGIVQEFQFGMNWSDYSRFVGDVFGAPLAIEGLLAFFLESTFLGPVDLRLGQAAPAGCTPRACGSCTSARCCRRTSSWRRTPGCSTRSATSSTPTPAAPSSPTSRRCCSTRCSWSRSRTWCWRRTSPRGVFMVAVAGWLLRLAAKHDADREHVPQGASGSAPSSRWWPASASPSRATSRARS